MREIKFRGNDGIGWIYGITIDYDEETDTYYMLLNREYDEWIMVGNIGQFTGLKDKNGKEIYEGDIVEEVGDQHYLWIVEWNQDDCCFDVRDQFSDTFFDTVDLNAIFRHGEVIGNIYENPELLEDKYETRT